MATNQGVVGSIPASRTKRQASELQGSEAFSFPGFDEPWPDQSSICVKIGLMSKAFTKESDGDDDDDVGALPPLPVGGKNYITPQGYQRIKDELLDLIDNERPKIVEIVHWAASNGDRSENGDYLYGKKRLREIDRRIRFLTRRLDLAEVVDPARQINADQVFFGATVTIADEQGNEQTYQIVGVDETDFSRNRISWISPLARALLKAREGDLVRFQSPAGWREVEVLSIEYKAIDDEPSSC